MNTYVLAGMDTDDLLLEVAVLHHLRAHHTDPSSPDAIAADVALDGTALALWLQRQGSLPTRGQLHTVLAEIAETAEHSLLEHDGDAASAIAGQQQAIDSTVRLLPDTPPFPIPAPVAAPAAPSSADLAMPEGYNRATFASTPAAMAVVASCPTCQRGERGTPLHWPSERCGGGNGVGKPFRAHCTCDTCF